MQTQRQHGGTHLQIRRERGQQPGSRGSKLEKEERTADPRNRAVRVQVEAVKAQD